MVPELGVVPPSVRLSHNSTRDAPLISFCEFANGLYLLSFKQTNKN
jgi:hypothetical protein